MKSPDLYNNNFSLTKIQTLSIDLLEIAQVIYLLLAKELKTDSAREPLP